MRRFAPLLCLALGCADATKPAPAPGIWSYTDTYTGQVIITNDTGDSSWPSDPVTIHAADIRGDSLVMTVSFGGGCRPHTFLLLADAAWMESYPVQTAVRLAHESNDDGCKALVSRVIRFDLSPLKEAYRNSYQTRSGIIRLRIQGSTASPIYQW